MYQPHHTFDSGHSAEVLQRRSKRRLGVPATPLIDRDHQRLQKLCFLTRLRLVCRGRDVAIVAM